MGGAVSASHEGWEWTWRGSERGDTDMMACDGGELPMAGKRVVRGFEVWGMYQCGESSGISTWVPVEFHMQQINWGY